MSSDEERHEANSKVSWIYKLNREALIDEMKRYELDTSGTVRELRQRLSSHLQETASFRPRHEAAEITRTLEDSDFNRRFSSLFTGTKAKTASNSPAAPVERANNVSMGEIMDRVRKWGLHFDGKRDPMMFTERLDELMTAYEIPSSQLLLALPEFFKGNALLWYRNNRIFWRTWEDFIKAFKKFYFPANFTVKLEDEIRARTQGARETARDFIVAITTLLRRHGGFTREAQLERMFSNLRPEYKTYIRRRDFQNLDELMELADEYERLQMETKNFRAPPPPSQAYVTETAYQGRSIPHSSPIAVAAVERRPESFDKRSNKQTIDKIRPNYDSKKDCWRCGQPNHSRTVCKNPSKLFCAICGKLNTLTRDCHPVQSGNLGQVRNVREFPDQQ